MKLKMMLLSVLMAFNVCAEPTTVILPVGSGGLIHKYALEMQPFFNKHLDGVVYDLKPGVNGLVGAKELIENKTDKMVLMMGSVHKWKDIDPLTDMIPIAYMGTFPAVLFTNPNSKFSTIKQFVDYGRNNTVSYGVPNASNNGKLIRRLVENHSTSKNFIEVPYKSGSPITVDVVGGHLESGVSIPINIKDFVDTGKIVPLVVFAPKRTHYLPNVPTTKESGFFVNGEYKYYNNVFLFANKNANNKDVEKLKSAILNYFNSAESSDIVKKMDLHFVNHNILSPQKYIMDILSE